MSKALKYWSLGVKDATWSDVVIANVMLGVVGFLGGLVWGAIALWIWIF